jgi:hypothetical protein
MTGRVMGKMRRLESLAILESAEKGVAGIEVFVDPAKHG